MVAATSARRPPGLGSKVDRLLLHGEIQLKVPREHAHQAAIRNRSRAATPDGAGSFKELLARRLVPKAKEPTMQPNDLQRARPTPQPPAVAGQAAFPIDDQPDVAATSPPAPIRLEAATLLVEARFRDITIASRLMRADRPGRFWIGPGRRADAPVNPAWLGDPQAGHALIEQTAAGLTLNLAPAMRAELRTPVQRLPIPPDMGHADRPLALPADSYLYVACGEVAFELRAVDAPPLLPRPRLPPGWRADLRYPLGVALALAALLGIAHLIPGDPRALSLDMLGAEHRMGHTVTIPLDVAAPVVDRALAAHAAAGGGAPAARGPSGQAGDRHARETNRRMAIQGTARPEDARAAAAKFRTTGILAVLDGSRSSPVADVFAKGPVLGADAQDALGQLVGTTIGNAYGVGGLGIVGIGSGGDGMGEGTLGVGRIATKGRFGRGSGGDGSYGTSIGIGDLGRRQARGPEILPGIGSVTGSLDKEIIRREIRRHLNEVRFCYEQGLTKKPALEGRLVVHFTIAPTGRVLVAVPQSSTLGLASVDECVVQAVRRWQFPQPAGGGLAMVSYPFQLSRAGQ
jgi:TonB family protein